MHQTHATTRTRTQEEDDDDDDGFNDGRLANSHLRQGRPNGQFGPQEADRDDPLLHLEEQRQQIGSLEADDEDEANERSEKDTD